MATVEELLYLETDGACAHCGFKDNRALTIHHLERADPPNEAYDNKVLLCHNCHQCYHQHKGPTTDELLEIKRRLIIKTLTRPGLNALKEANRRNAVIAMPFLVNHLIELGYLAFEDTLTSWSDDDDRKADAIIDASYKLTDDGRGLLGKWQL